MPKVTEQYSQARRQQIIDAAYRCIARKGFRQTTMRDIYEEAGLSAGAVYNYFESKHDIIAASFSFDYERSLGLFEAAEQSDDPLGALIDMLSFLFAGLKEAAALGASRVNVQGWGEALVNPELLKTVDQVLGIYRDITGRIVQKAQATGRLDSDLDPPAVSNALISLYYGLELQLALNPGLDVDGYTGAVRALLREAAHPISSGEGANARSRLPAPEQDAMD
jgi:TetR/AcrR family transcriptional regulator, transcriptional repressor of aconitase